MAKILPIEQGIKFFKTLLNNFNRKTALRKSARKLVKLAARRIETGKDPFGKKFIPNSPLTVALKGSNKPLVDTGQMKRSYFYKIDKNKDLFIGNRKRYAIKHQVGNGVPPRPVLDAEIDSNVVIESFREEVAKSLRRFGG